MGATGESRRKVTASGYGPAWSPDGRRLAVVSERTTLPPTTRGASSRLSIVDAASGTARQVTALDAMGPSWSPDGRWIAFWGLREGSFQRDLWIVPSDASVEGAEAAQALTDDAAVDWSPLWAPDGKWLYLGSSRGGTFNLWRLPIDPATGRPRGEAEPVTAPSSWAGPLSVARDGRTFLFVDRNAETSLERAPLDLRGRRLSAPPAEVIRGSFEFRDQCLSPDGQWIVFTNEDLPQHLHLVRADGTGYRQLTDGPDRNRQPSWSPDGHRLAFQTTRGHSSLAVLGADGSGWQAVPVSRPVSWPVWSPDGRTIAFIDVDRGGVLLDVGSGLAAPTERLLPEIEPDLLFWPRSWSPDGRLLAGLGFRHAGIAEGQYVWSGTTAGYRLLRGLGARALDTTTVKGAPMFVDSGHYVYTDEVRLYLAHLSGAQTLLHEALPGHWLDTPTPSRDGRWLTWIDRADESDIWLMTLEEAATTE